MALLKKDNSILLSDKLMYTDKVLEVYLIIFFYSENVYHTI